MSTFTRPVLIHSLGACVIGLGVCSAVAPTLFASSDGAPIVRERNAAAPDAKLRAPAADSRSAGLPIHPAALRADRGGTSEDAKNRFLMMLYLHGSGSRDDLWSHR